MRRIRSKRDSELGVPQKASDLVDMINRVIREGLEGLVLKDVKVSWSHPLLSSALARTWLRQFEVLGAAAGGAFAGFWM